MNFDAWGLETESETYDAAQDWYDNNYDGDDYDKFDDWWKDNQEQWYKDRGEAGYNIFSDDYKTHLVKANAEAREKLLSGSASTSIKEQLDVLAHEGQLTKDRTDNLKGVVNKHIDDSLNTSDQYINFSEHDVSENDHKSLFGNYHGSKKAYEVYIHGKDIVNLHSRDLHLFMSLRGYKDGQTAILVSCDAASYSKGRYLAKRIAADVYSSQGTATFREYYVWSGMRQDGQSYYSESGWVRSFPDGRPDEDTGRQYIKQ